MPFGQLVVDHIENQANPEVLLHVAWQHIKAIRSRREDTPLPLLRKQEKGLESLTNMATA